MTKNQIKATLIALGSEARYSGKLELFYVGDSTIAWDKQCVVSQIITGLAYYFDYAITFNGVEDTITYDKFRNALGDENHHLMLEFSKADKTRRDLEEKLSKLSWDTEEYQILAGMSEAAMNECIEYHTQLCQ